MFSNKQANQFNMSIVYGVYEEQTLENDILPYYSNTSKNLVYALLKNRDHKTNLVRLSPKIAGLSNHTFNQEITPLFTDKLIIRILTPEPINVEDKDESIYLINPYLVIPLVMKEGELIILEDAFDEWDKKVPTTGKPRRHRFF